MSDGRVPLIVLTGFLGAGKTTILNRVLGAQHRRRVAVLVNELGRIDVDAALIRARAGDVIELAGGCVCHQLGVQQDLWTGIAEVVARSRPEVLVLETTGIAQPAAIRRSLDRAPAVIRTLARVAAVITVVDAEVGARDLDRYEEARDQVIEADAILISKTDLADAARLTELHRRLRGLNGAAERASFPPGAAGTAALVPWLLEPRPAAEGLPAEDHPGGRDHPDRHAHPHAHQHQLAAASYVDAAPLVAEAVLLLFEALGPSLVRAKGWVHLAGEERRGFLERAGDRTTLVLGDPWRAGEARETRLVLIGDGLDEATLHPRLWACRAAAGGV